MLRSKELRGARRDELFDLDGDNPRFDVPHGGSKSGA